MIQAILFDMNGVIVDDETLHKKAFQKICQEHGVHLSDEAYETLAMGRNDFDGFGAIIDEFNLQNTTVGDLVEQKHQEYARSIKIHGIIAYPGIKEMIPFLAKNYRLAVVTGSLRAEAENTLHSLGLHDYFDAIITAEDAHRGKPNPAPYLMAANRLGLSAEECAVIEDSPAGVASAKSARMKCVAITNTHASDMLSRADFIISNIIELKQLAPFA